MALLSEAGAHVRLVALLFLLAFAGCVDGPRVTAPVHRPGCVIRLVADFQTQDSLAYMATDCWTIEASQ